MENSIEYRFGIDFGTTNSTVVCFLEMEEGIRKIKIADIHDGPIPSIIGINKKNTSEVVYGRELWEQRQQMYDDYEIISRIKADIDKDKVWVINGEKFTPTDIASKLFDALNDRVEKTLSVRMKEAVVAVPAGFAAKKRERLREAAKRAGIQITSFISESTAAIFKNYKEIGHYKKVAIFDWGGGTLDVSVVENSGGAIKELGIRSLELGGENIDEILTQKIHERICDAREKYISYEKVSEKDKDKLRVRCEEAKRRLSDDDIVSIQLNSYSIFGVIREKMSYEWFSELVNFPIKAAIDTFNKALQLAEVDISELGCILMVGGTSKLRPLQEKLAEVWKDINVIYPYDPEWDIAFGAAKLSKYPGKTVLNQNLGLLLSDDSIMDILKVGDEIPTQVKEYQLALVEDSKSANFVFVEKQNNFVEYKNIGNVVVRAFGFFQEEFVVKAQVNGDGIFKCSIKSSQRDEIFRQKIEYADLKYIYHLPLEEEDKYE
ncbi:Hsp70 family protein [Cellulosilyticum sp. ST5]|uniref:Hsp70 family protein n=1 Tax=Cellulosilyticum sp. ST5 TaxID=3055805 RepID=UPI003977683C